MEIENIFETTLLASKMEKIISNPGLQHLAEEVFWNLDIQDLYVCTQINQSCKQILENPLFWLKKLKNLSKENQKDWIKILKEVKNSEKIHDIISYLEFIHILYLADV